jgi:hypothetical protein
LKERSTGENSCGLELEARWKGLGLLEWESLRSVRVERFRRADWVCGLEYEAR